jgi:Lar family restriction alleviation protein
MNADDDSLYVTRRARGTLPCPFCGNKKLEMEIDSWNQHTKYAHVRCPKCFAHGPDADEDEIGSRAVVKTATAFWNKRTQKVKI